MYSNETLENLILMRGSIIYDITNLENKSSKTICEYIHLFRQRRKFSKVCSELLRRGIRRHTL